MGAFIKKALRYAGGVHEFAIIIIAAAVAIAAVCFADPILSVKAEEQYTVTYDGNGATSGAMSADTATYGQAFITAKNAFARTGYSFNGWNEKADGTGTRWGLDSAGVAEHGTSWTWAYDHDITLYAQWKRNSYTVTYNGNGATSGSMRPDTAVYGQDFITTKNAFVKDGYKFDGWNDKADGTGTVWGLGSNGVAEYGHPWVWSYDHDVTLYAQWKAAKYISLGWNTQPDGSGISYQPGDALPDANLDLYAQWIQSTYDFSYTGAVQQFIAPVSGTYQLEVWGAGSGIPLNQGAQNPSAVGRGGYSSGNVSLTKDDTLYISVGGKGEDAIIGQAAGGWNGGGSGDWDHTQSELDVGESESTGGGGGATSIQRTLIDDGQLQRYEAVKDTDVLIVAGGAGSMMSGHTESPIRSDGGGESGIAGMYEQSSVSKTLPIPGTQTSGYAFGQGGRAEHKYWNSELGAGGGGWYGGGAAIDTGDLTYVDGAGGSGHIGAMLTNGTTVAGNQSFSAPDGSAETGHSGNGYARITLIAPSLS